MKNIFVISFLFCFIFCLAFSKQDTVKIKKVNKMPIQKVQEKYTYSLMSIVGVQGIGIGKKGDKDCIVIFIGTMTKDMRKKLPKELEGYPVKIEKTGEFRANSPRR